MECVVAHCPSLLPFWWPCFRLSVLWQFLFSLFICLFRYCFFLACHCDLFSHHYNDASETVVWKIVLLSLINQLVNNELNHNSSSRWKIIGSTTPFDAALHLGILRISDTRCISSMPHSTYVTPTHCPSVCMRVCTMYVQMFIVQQLVGNSPVFLKDICKLMQWSNHGIRTNQPVLSHSLAWLLRPRLNIRQGRMC